MLLVPFKQILDRICVCCSAVLVDNGSSQLDPKKETETAPGKMLTFKSHSLMGVWRHTASFLISVKHVLALKTVQYDIQYAVKVQNYFGVWICTAWVCRAAGLEKSLNIRKPSSTVSQRISSHWCKMSVHQSLGKETCPTTTFQVVQWACSQ